jgi:hypothetical protein
MPASRCPEERADRRRGFSCVDFQKTAAVAS